MPNWQGDLIPDGFTIGINDGVAAGQAVPHAHIHGVAAAQTVRVDWRLVEVVIQMAFTLKVKGFDNGEAIPKSYTCDGEDSSPALEWANEPPGAQSFALIMDDPDAPAGTWTHWLLWDIPAHMHSLSEGFRPGTVGEGGKNDFGQPGYGGPCPPKGHGVHRYHFTLYALDRPVLGLPPGARRQELDRALKGRVLARTQYAGRYGRGK